jgi:hypothetical protein
MGAMLTTNVRMSEARMTVVAEPAALLTAVALTTTIGGRT